jgi:hypothetical protein
MDQNNRNDPQKIIDYLSPNDAQAILRWLAAQDEEIDVYGVDARLLRVCARVGDAI